MVVMRTANTASRLRTPRRSMSSSANESTAVTSTPAQSGTAPQVSSDSAIAQPITCAWTAPLLAAALCPDLCMHTPHVLTHGQRSWLARHQRAPGHTSTAPT